MTMKKECQICCEFYSTSLFHKITENCNHELDVCEICVNKHISTQLNDQGNMEINCPFDECKQKIQHDDIKKIASKELFERFDTLMVRQALRNIPEFRWCKNSSCNSGQIHLKENEEVYEPIMTCEACGQRTCYTHDIPWHQGLTCPEYEDIKKGEDQDTKDFLGRRTKPCPKCGVRIIKDGGCDHMTCTVKTCGHNFIWS